MNTESATNDLTQLSSREQLSALMDGALPADQTRFLLRRLQHDAPLAECWERWRLTGEVMRGLAPAQRLPADFATRVGAALHGGALAEPPVEAMRSPAWLRWGGGAAMAASLMVVALMARQPQVDTPIAPGRAAVSSIDSTAITAAPVTGDSPLVDAGSSPRPAVTGRTAAARPARNRSDASPRAVPATGQAVAPAQVATIDTLPPGVSVPQPDIVTRPWPRSVLPQYSSSGLVVGFGEHARGVTVYNPFPPQLGNGALVDVSDAYSPVSEHDAGGAKPQP